MYNPDFPENAYKVLGILQTIMLKPTYIQNKTLKLSVYRNYR